MPVSDQPDYVNGVASFTSSLTPKHLLDALHAIEAEAGRVRTITNAARVLDLDILAIGGSIFTTPTLTIPHPRLHERAFVLRPLCDIAPGWRHPSFDRSALDLYQALPPQAIERLPA